MKFHIYDRLKDFMGVPTKNFRPKLSKDAQGVSSVIGTVLVLGLTITAITVILMLSMEVLKDAERSTQYQNVLSQFESLDATVEDMVREGNEAGRVTNIVFNDGRLIANKGNDIWILSYNLTGVNATMLDLEDGDNQTKVDTQGNVNIIIHWLGGENEGEVDFSNINKAPGDTIYTTHNITGTVKIEINNYTTNKTIGRLWVFNMACFEYQLDSKTCALENGGIISEMDGVGSVVNDPLFYEAEIEGVAGIEKILSMRFIQISPNSSYRGLRNINKVLVTLEKNRFGENAVVFGFKLEIYGEHADAWLRYFEMHHDFQRDGNTVTFNDLPAQFHLGYSEIGISYG